MINFKSVTNTRIKCCFLLLAALCTRGHFTLAQDTPPPEPPPVPQPYVVWEPSATTTVTEYRLHRSETIGFEPKDGPQGNPDSTFVEKFTPVPANPDNPFRYEHPKTLQGAAYYYKVQSLNNGKLSTSNEVAVIKSGQGNYVFNIAYNNTSLRLRAIAGAVANDDWHTIPLNMRITITKNGQALPKAQEFIFALTNNPGTDNAEPKRARLIDVQDNPNTADKNEKEPDSAALWPDRLPNIADETRDLNGDSIQRNSDGSGDVVVRVLSGQTITKQTKLVIRWKETEGDNRQTYDIAQLPLDFGQVESRRLFGLPEFGEGYDRDTGWEPLTADGKVPDYDGSADSTPAKYLLTHPGDTVYVRLHLKFKINPELRDVQYKATDKGPLPADSNWANVKGHTVRVTIAEVARKYALMYDPVSKEKKSTSARSMEENWAAPSEFAKYVRFVNNQGQEVDEVSVTVNTNGISEPIRIRAGIFNNAHQTYVSLIHKCIHFSLLAVDQTQYTP